MADKSTKTKVNLNDLSTWNVPVLIVLGVAIIGAVCFAAKTFVIDDVTQQIESLDGKVAKEEKTYLENQRTIALLPHIRKEVKDLEVIRNKAKKFLPTEQDMPALIDSVYLAARDNGIVFSRFTPEKDINSEYYTIKPIALSAEVGYLSMSSFIEQITTLKRIMNVESVSFRQSKTSKEFSKNPNEPLNMTAQLRTYVFKDDDTKAKK